MSLTPEILKKRTFDFALKTLKTIDGLKSSPANDIMGKQVMRSSTSVGTNYRAACKAKSSADFVYKLKIVEEESDESTYWLELLKSYNEVNNADFELLLKESKELEKIFSASVITAKNNKKINKSSII
jgi:four helix bundle protein